ncbi:hypothetical protein C1925_19670 [Stenotrophomonas sp. SAU14A_NAIMI4_5]|nr:hypothetical protein C1925_19670 [Stenotrophomonas sp. SAU14A_NAIMI4_5]
MTGPWRPLTRAEMEALVAKQLGDCTPDQQAAFATLRVLFHTVPLHRLGGVEPVWVVAHLADGWLYYEDVEEGFEVSVPGEDGALPERACNQYELTHILYQQAHAGLGRQR